MSATTVTLTSRTSAIHHVDQISAASAQAVSKYLQHNHDEWHIIWDPNPAKLMHNHQVHYLLTDLALGASTEQIEKAFELNKGYMRPAEATDESRSHVVDQETYSESLGHVEYYAAFLRYFQDVIVRKGWQKTLSEDVFSGTPAADDLLGRLFEGAVHPIIHLGFGVEFEQPALIAEALAQAAIHPESAGSLLLRVESLARSSLTWTDERLMDLFPRLRCNTAITDAECWKGGSYERDGDFFAEAPPALLPFLATYHLDPDSSAETVHMRIAEMINVVVWMTAAAQRPDKQVKFDFFLMHAVNCTIFLSVFATQQPWLSLKSLIRLLEFKVRVDLVLYLTQGCPEARPEQIVNYRPRRPACMNWPHVIDRAKNISCDGHVVKFIRALAHGAEVCRPYEDREDTRSRFPVRKDMWLKIANIVLDSTEDHPHVLHKWMRGPGYERAWDVVPDRN